MRIQILSDLHLEFHMDGGQEFLANLPVGADTLVVAGDLTTEPTLLAVLAQLCRRWRDVIYVIGNHEMYGSSFGEVRGTLSDAAMENLHVLDNDGLELHGQGFVGTTLWFRETEETRTYKGTLNDFRLIEDFERHVYHENRKAIEFLEGATQPGDIVVTHHIPAMQGVPAKYRRSALNHYFLCDMEAFILERKPAFWVYGHTHDSVDAMVGSTRLICNPVGYPHEEATGCVFGLVIEV